MNRRSIKVSKSLRSNLGPKLADLLREAIIQGEFRPGEKINETQLAAKLGVSKSPIREAIRILESENIVETIDRRGTFVKDLSDKEVEEIYQVVKLINVAAARLAAGKMNEKRKRELRLLVEKMREAQQSYDMNKVKPLSIRFHGFIINMTENRLLLKIHNGLETQQERFRAKGLQYGSKDIADIISEHVAISEALLKGDPEEAELQMLNHLESARVRVGRFLDPD